MISYDLINTKRQWAKRKSKVTRSPIYQQSYPDFTKTSSWLYAGFVWVNFRSVLVYDEVVCNRGSHNGSYTWSSWLIWKKSDLPAVCRFPLCAVPPLPDGLVVLCRSEPPFVLFVLVGLVVLCRFGLVVLGRLVEEGLVVRWWVGAEVIADKWWLLPATAVEPMREERFHLRTRRRKLERNGKMIFSYKRCDIVLRIRFKNRHKKFIFLRGGGRPNKAILFLVICTIWKNCFLL